MYFSDTGFVVTLVSEDVESYYTTRVLELQNVKVRCSYSSYCHLNLEHHWRLICLDCFHEHYFLLQISCYSPMSTETFSPWFFSRALCLTH